MVEEFAVSVLWCGFAVWCEFSFFGGVVPAAEAVDVHDTAVVAVFGHVCECWCLSGVPARRVSSLRRSFRLIFGRPLVLEVSAIVFLYSRVRIRCT